MLLKQVVRRNRRRQLLIVAAAWLNWWCLVAVLFTIAGWVVREKRRPSPAAIDQHVTPTWSVVITASVTIGALVAGAVVLVQLVIVRRRTIAAIGAVPLDPAEHARIVNLIAELAIATGTPPVDGAILRDPAPNAMAIGSSPARTTIVVTTGLLEHASRDELEAVLAVEMCSVRRLDTAIRTAILSCTQGPMVVNRELLAGRRDLSWIERWASKVLIGAVTGPSLLAARALRRCGLRTGDFAADDMAVAITRNPSGLRRALQRLDDHQGVVRLVIPATAPMWFEPVPFAGQTTSASGAVWSAPLSERIARLPTVPERERTIRS